MIRQATAALANAWNTIVRPTPEPFPMMKPMVAPNFIVHTHFAPPPSQRIYEYRMRDATTSTMFLGLLQSDLMGYPYTRGDLIRALDTYYAMHGPIKAHTVILDARDWIGSFVVDENVNDDVLVLQLVDGADMRIRKTEALMMA
jgi:hypothetical protein